MNEKIKDWFEEHEMSITKWCAYTVGFSFGYVAGKRILTTRVATGLEVAHAIGVIKFFDPSTGVEVKDLTKVVKVLKKTM